MGSSVLLPHIPKSQGKKKFVVRASCELIPKPSKVYTFVYTTWKHTEFSKTKIGKTWNIARLQYPGSFSWGTDTYLQSIACEEKWCAVLPGLAIIAFQCGLYLPHLDLFSSTGFMQTSAVREVRVTTLKMAEPYNVRGLGPWITSWRKAALSLRNPCVGPYINKK